MSDGVYERRFGGIQRLYGREAAEFLRQRHVAVIGIGGVGSWAVEALARSGVGTITLIDNDTICETNMNRQIHTLGSTVDHAKVLTMAARVKEINPQCDCRPIDDFLTMKTMEEYLDRGYDYVIDAIDSIKFKAEMIAFCKRRKLPILVTGGAGGLSDPTAIQIADLSRTHNDPLLAKVRSRLRREYGFTRNPKRRFGVECVFSSEQQVYPKDDGSVGFEKPGIHGVSLDCRFGYGAASFVTATFGFVAVSRVLRRLADQAGTAT